MQYRCSEDASVDFLLSLQRSLPSLCAALAVLVCAVLSGTNSESAAGESESSIDLYGDPIPDGAVARLGTVRYRHPGWYKRIAALEDGKTFAVGTEDSGIRLWNVRSGKSVREFDLGSARLQAFCLSHDRTKIAILAAEILSETREYEVRLSLWNVSSGEELSQISWTDPMREAAYRIAVAPDGNIVAVGTRDGRLRLWDINAKVELLEYQIVQGEVETLDFSPDGALIAVAGQRNVALWNWSSGEEPKSLKGFKQGAQVVKFSPDGSLLAIGESDTHAAEIWDVASIKRLHRLRGEAERYYREGLCFFEDGRQLIVPASNSKQLEFFDIDSGQLVRALDCGSFEPRDVAISKDGSLLATVGSRAAILAWDMDSESVLTERFEGHLEAPDQISFTSDGATIVTGCNDATIRLWDTDSGRPIRILRHDRWVTGSALSPTGDRLVSCGLDDTVRLWDCESGEQIFKLFGHGRTGGSSSTAVGFVADGTRFMSFGGDLYLRVMDATTGKILAEHAIRPVGLDIEESEDGTLVAKNADPFGGRGGMAGMLRGAAFSLDGTILLFSVQGGRTPASIHAIDTATGEEIDVFRPEDSLRDFAVSPDCNLLATIEQSARDRSFIRLRDFATKEVKRNLEFAGVFAHRITFSPDGTLLACAMAERGVSNNQERWISIWTVPSLKEIGRIDQFADQAMRLAFSPDGNRLVSSHNDTTVVVWDVDEIRTGKSQ